MLGWDLGKILAPVFSGPGVTVVVTREGEPCVCSVEGEVRESLGLEERQSGVTLSGVRLMAESGVEWTRQR